MLILTILISYNDFSFSDRINRIKKEEKIKKKISPLIELKNFTIVAQEVSMTANIEKNRYTSSISRVIRNVTWMTC